MGMEWIILPCVCSGAIKSTEFFGHMTHYQLRNNSWPIQYSPWTFIVFVLGLICNTVNIWLCCIVPHGRISVRNGKDVKWLYPNIYIHTHTHTHYTFFRSKNLVKVTVGCRVSHNNVKYTINKDYKYLAYKIQMSHQIHYTQLIIKLNNF
jgi:hypothetical protein